MIKSPTMLVIGAGASRPYGYPTGAELWKQARELNPGSHVYKLICQSGLGAVEDLNSVLDDIRQHIAPSLDAYLEHRKHDPAIMRIGRALIAAIIGTVVAEHRRIGMKVSQDEDWLALVIERMRAGASTWQDFANGNDRLRFVTFNFDDVIESRLAAALRSIYRGQMSDTDLQSVLRAFPVIHVHGQLPRLPLDGRLNPDMFDAFPFEWLEWIRKATESINVVMDAISGGVLDQAHRVIRESNVFCFLGFAFATENLQRLRLPDALQGRGVRLFASTTGERDGARERIGEIFRDGHGGPYEIELGTKEQGCRDLLLDHYVLRW